jgi:hypothetical protein
LKRFAPIIVVAGLLIGTATAFAVTEHLKLEDSPVIGTRFPGLFSPKMAEERIGFRLRREEDIRLDVVDSDGNVVRHAVGQGIFGQAFHQFAWDGRDDSGRIVPDGTYHFQLTLKDEGRTIEFPKPVVADSTPPTIEDVNLRHQVFSPDGDGRADRVDIRYRFNEPAYAVLYVDGKRQGRSHARRPAGTRQWYGRGAAPGEHRVALAAQDLAGNIAGSTRAFPVRIRYVMLFRDRFVPRGTTMHPRVSTDAKVVRWSLGGRSGAGRPPRLSIPVPTRPGWYVLAVTVGGHTAVATVVVR